MDPESAPEFLDRLFSREPVMNWLGFSAMAKGGRERERLSSKSDSTHDICIASVHRAGDTSDKWIETISSEPKASVYHNFLAIQATHINSLVLDTATGKRYISGARSSTGTYLCRGQDETIRDIEQRIANWTLIPVAQMSRKEVRLHSLLPKGTTVLFLIGIRYGKAGLSVKPRRGDALLFWSMKPDGSLYPTSLHAGCPVIKGEKWCCTKWLRVNEFKI
ncbi:LOW QUALITY PROTEIN: hypothetical protein V2J09_009894 [Rumex salicifolius]